MDLYNLPMAPRKKTLSSAGPTQSSSANRVYFELLSEHLGVDSKGSWQQSKGTSPKRKLKRPGQRSGQSNKESKTEAGTKEKLPASSHSGATPPSSSKVFIPRSKLSSDEEELDSESGDEFDDADFEDVEIRPVAAPQISDSVTVTIRPTRKRKPKLRMVSNEERKLRRQIHLTHLVSMLAYGRMITKWINNTQLKLQYASQVPKNVYTELHPSLRNKDWSSTIKSRYFLDGLRHLMELWAKKFRITSSTGIFKMGWNEIENKAELDEIKKKNGTDLSKESLLYNLAHYSGNRDHGAQGFVTLLRSVQVHSRLVFSIQPPDFTIASFANKDEPSSESDLDEPKRKSTKKTKTPPKKSNVARIPKFSSPNNKSVLQKIINSHNRTHNVQEDRSYHLERLLKSNPYLSPYPVFWAEAWNPYAKKWIAVDPVNFRIIEDIFRVSKLEPPMSDQRNNLLYAIAFDKNGFVKDVTRRYAEHLNSRTRRKRITRDKSGYADFNRILDAFSSKKAPTQAELAEEEYFVQRNVKEGMPSNIGDFRNHPVYCIESQLRSNEILYPKEPCGYVSQKSGGRTVASIPVYPRKDVQELRSAKGWFHQGRLIKMGERNLRVKQKPKRKRYAGFSFKEDETNNQEDEEENIVRLYAFFQTELYKPEPVKNGIVPKNAYGNLDVYTDSMIPEGGALVTLKFAIQAAKLLGIDYSPAVVGFDFGRKSSSKPKVGGVVVAKEFEEAVLLVNDHLKEVDIERQKKQAANKALKAWNLVFAKLRIVERLNREHGVIESEAPDLSEESEDDSYQEPIGEGGFLPVDMNQDTLRRDDMARQKAKRDARKAQLDLERLSSSEDEDFGGGYLMEGNGGDRSDDGGDAAEGDEGGGFFVADKLVDEQRNDLNDFNETKDNNDESEDMEGGFILEENSPEIVTTNQEKPVVQSKERISEDIDDDYVYNPYEETRELETASTKQPSNEKTERDMVERTELDTNDTPMNESEEVQNDPDKSENDKPLRTSLSSSLSFREYEISAPHNESDEDYQFEYSDIE